MQFLLQGVMLIHKWGTIITYYSLCKQMHHPSQRLFTCDLVQYVAEDHSMGVILCNMLQKITVWV